MSALTAFTNKFPDICSQVCHCLVTSLHQKLYKYNVITSSTRRYFSPLFVCLSISVDRISVDISVDRIIMKFWWAVEYGPMIIGGCIQARIQLHCCNEACRRYDRDRISAQCLQVTGQLVHLDMYIVHTTCWLLAMHNDVVSSVPAWQGVFFIICAMCPFPYFKAIVENYYRKSGMMVDIVIDSILSLMCHGPWGNIMQVYYSSDS